MRHAALRRAEAIGFGRFIVTATTPFTRDDLARLGTDAPGVLRERVPAYEAVYSDRGWRMLDRLDRVYVNDRAREALGWEPRWNFGHALEQLAAGEDPRSTLARAVGAKGYHPESFGVYTVR